MKNNLYSLRMKKTLLVILIAAMALLTTDISSSQAIMIFDDFDVWQAAAPKYEDVDLDSQLSSHTWPESEWIVLPIGRASLSFDYAMPVKDSFQGMWSNGTSSGGKALVWQHSVMGYNELNVSTNRFGLTGGFGFEIYSRGPETPLDVTLTLNLYHYDTNSYTNPTFTQDVSIKEKQFEVDTAAFFGWTYDKDEWVEGFTITCDNTNYDYMISRMVVAPVPEPSTMLLLGTGLFGLAGFRKKLKKRTHIQGQ